MGVRLVRLSGVVIGFYYAIMSLNMILICIFLETPRLNLDPVCDKCVKRLLDDRLIYLKAQNIITKDDFNLVLG